MIDLIDALESSAASTEKVSMFLCTMHCNNLCDNGSFDICCNRKVSNIINNHEKDYYCHGLKQLIISIYFTHKCVK